MDITMFGVVATVRAEGVGAEACCDATQLAELQCREL